MKLWRVNKIKYQIKCETVDDGNCAVERRSLYSAQSNLDNSKLEGNDTRFSSCRGFQEREVRFIEAKFKKTWSNRGFIVQTNVLKDTYKRA